VGAARNDEDSHPRRWYAPKLMVAGRLTGSLDGRPVVIDADDSGLVLSIAMFQSLWGMRRIAGSVGPVLGLFKHHGIPVRVRVAGLVSVEVLPRPSALARFFVPSLMRWA
jgi:hypothetical protein